jgi:hypothetical protein
MESAITDAEEYSDAAELGTCAHEVAAICLEQEVDPSTLIGQYLNDAPFVEVTEEIADDIREYCTFVNAIEGVLYVEEEVTFEQYVPNSHGTADAIIVSYDDVITVCDLKYGIVEVSAENNYQLRLYALGALNKYGAIRIKSVKMVIYQPRIGNYSEEFISVQELKAWGNDVVRQAFYLTVSDRPLCFPGQVQCKWCKAKANCVALKRHVDGITESITEVDTITESQMAEILDNKSLIKSFLEAVEKRAYGLLERGDNLPGYKLVKGRGRKQWKNEAKVLLWKYLFERTMVEPTMISPAQALKIAKKEDKENVMNLIDVVIGKPNMVKSSDKRSAHIGTNVDDYFKVINDAKVIIIED